MTDDPMTAAASAAKPLLDRVRNLEEVAIEHIRAEARAAALEEAAAAIEAAVPVAVITDERYWLAAQHAAYLVRSLIPATPREDGE